MSVVIKVEHLSKQYRLGEVGTGSMRDDFIRWRYRMMGKEDPFLTVGEENHRTVKSSSEYVWALKDINFEVKQGEILGIIGKNGAGKSTLLKILSRTTGPTKGSVRMKGRIASLLEVGTGFHGELSGRENIFLNGAIMGMNKAEIKSKLDEIIDFAGVEKYIDTPVKRYSSGMYVRLAFGVAAHLDPDIMIVDEVLAVGDAEFQKKALGKMKDVSTKAGRTVLFVSHNMAAIKQLCENGILMNYGKIEIADKIIPVLEKYQQEEHDSKSFSRDLGRNILNKSIFASWKLMQNGIERNDQSVVSEKPFTITFLFESKQILTNVELGLVIYDSFDLIIFSTNSRDYGQNFIHLNNNQYSFSFEVNLPIKSGKYKIDIALLSEGILIDQWVPSKKLFVLNNYNSVLPEKWLGIITNKSKFQYEELY